MDSTRGHQLYKFDRSLMERLADSNFPMSQINVQRRMRPSISHFPRYVNVATDPDNSDNKPTEQYCTRGLRITLLSRNIHTFKECRKMCSSSRIPIPRAGNKILSLNLINSRYTVNLFLTSPHTPTVGLGQYDQGFSSLFPQARRI